MGKFVWQDEKRGEVKLTDDQVADLLSKATGSKVTANKRRFRMANLAGLVAIGLVALIAIAGWDYEQRREYTDDGMVTRQYYVEFLAWDFPAYKTEKLTRAEWAQESLVNGRIKAELKDYQIHGVYDGKLIIENRRFDLNKEQSAKSD